MQTAFNTVLYPRGHLLEAVAEVSAAGYAGLELQPQHTLQLLVDPELRSTFAEALAAAGLQVAAVMVGYLRDAATLEQNVAAAQLGHELGTERLVVLPPQPWMCSPDAFADLARELGAACTELGIEVAVHHHAGTVLDTPQRIDAFAARRPHAAVGLCFDVAHYALFADDEARAAERLAPVINYVHVKDLVARTAALPFVPDVRNAQMSFRVVGDGTLEIGATVQRLRSAGYDGWLSVEVENFYRDRPDSARRSIEFLQEALS
jgi:inosose dehydratase